MGSKTSVSPKPGINKPKSFPHAVNVRNVSAGTAAAFHQTATFKILQSAGNGRPRDAKFLNQAGFGRDSIARLVVARLDATTHDFKDLPMLGGEWWTDVHRRRTPMGRARDKDRATSPISYCISNLRQFDSRCTDNCY